MLALETGEKLGDPFPFLQTNSSREAERVVEYLEPLVPVPSLLIKLICAGGAGGSSCCPG